MTEEQLALARRAVACKAWKWLPGMRAVRADAIAALLALRLVARDEGPGVSGSPPAEWLPDLDDPATKGALLGLVREAWGDQEFSAVAMPGYNRHFGWSCFVLKGADFYRGTEAEALVDALEAAP